MKELFINFEVHLYSENRLHDDQIERRKKGYGLYQTEFYIHLFSYIDKTIRFDLADGITIGEVKDLIYKKIFGTYTETEESIVNILFITPNYSFSIEDPRKDFINVLDKYLDPESKGLISVGLYICEDAGHFAQDGKLQFNFRSHEDGPHHKPHVHVSVIGKNYDEPINIITGDPIEERPKMPQKYLSQAKMYIIDPEHHYKFLDAWNNRTDGLKIDINKALGINEI